jgi:hypothetical protein
MGGDGGETKQCTPDMLNLYASLRIIFSNFFLCIGKSVLLNVLVKLGVVQNECVFVQTGSVTKTLFFLIFLSEVADKKTNLYQDFYNGKTSGILQAGRNLEVYIHPTKEERRGEERGDMLLLLHMTQSDHFAAVEGFSKAAGICS